MEKIMTDEEIRVEALRAALKLSERATNSFNAGSIVNVAALFEDYIRNGK